MAQFGALRFRLANNVVDGCWFPLNENMLRSGYHISGMKCSSKENMIRLKPDDLEEVKKPAFDLGSIRLPLKDQLLMDSG